MGRRTVPRGSSLLGDAFPEILAAAQAGAGWAATRLYEDLAGTVAGYLRAQGAREAEDLTSEVFLGVLRGLPGFRGDEGGFRSWVFTIAHRRLLDERRSLSRRPSRVPLDDAGEMVGGDVEVDALATIGDDRVRAALLGLTDDQRDVLLLRVVADLSLEDAAVVLDRKVNAVKQLQRRALGAMRRALDGAEVSS